MEFTLNFAANTPSQIVNRTYTLLSVIKGVNVTKLTLPRKTLSALLLQLDKQVVDSTHDFVTRHNVCPSTLAVDSPSQTSTSSKAATAAPDAVQTGRSTREHVHATAGNSGVSSITPAEAVLLGLSFLEAIQADKQLLHLLQEHGYLKSTTSSNSSGSGNEAKATGAANAAMRTQEQQQNDFLIPLLTQCGVLVSVTPVHDAAAVTLLKQQTWKGVLAPADAFRAYFGNHVGFYLAFLNSMTVWLMAPAVVSIYLTWALSSSSSSSTSTHLPHTPPSTDAVASVISSPLVPFLLVFHLLWSAAGLKLWRRQEAGLNHKWYSSSSSSGGGRGGGGRMPKQTHLGYPSQGSGVAAAPAGPEAAAAAAAVGEIGRMPGSSVAAARWSEGVPAASLITPAAAGVRREYIGNWFLNPITREVELLNPVHNQILRFLASIAATLLLLLAAAVVLLVCLNVQGYIPPHHRFVFAADLAALSLPGGVFGPDSGLILSQVPLVLRVVATIIFTSMIYGPAAKLLTAFENHRTVEGYAASLTAKQASLNALFTFAPVAYVGLLGAGAAAARADVAGFFRVELLRRILMEFLMPWITYWLSLNKVKRQLRAVKHDNVNNNEQLNPIKDAAGAVGALVEELTPRAAAAAAHHESSSSSTTFSQKAAVFESDKKIKIMSSGSVDTAAAVAECLKPAYDIFADSWEVNRDLGYMILFAALYPPAAVICLFYNLVKIKQDCLKLLVVYRRPVPAQLRGIGSWKAVLTVQVFAAVISNVFLSGLSTGQLALLLPSPVVPESVKTALVAAAAARPGSSTAANQMQYQGANVAAAMPVLSVLHDMGALSNGLSVPSLTAAAAAAMDGNMQHKSMNSTAWEAAQMCPNNASVALLQRAFSNAYCPTMQGSETGAGAGLSYSIAATADHLLLLFILEHALVVLMLLILWVVPNQPRVVRAAARQQQWKTMQLLQQQQQLASASTEHGLLGTHNAAKPEVALPGKHVASLHTNPLYVNSSARPSAQLLK